MQQRAPAERHLDPACKLLVQAGDRRLTVAAADVAAAPTTADKVVIISVVHQVIRVTTIEQDNEPITYELILRS